MDEKSKGETPVIAEQSPLTLEEQNTLQLVLQLRGSLEGDGLAGLDLNDLACPRISALALFPRFHIKRSEPGEGETLILADGACNFIKHEINDLPCRLLAEFDLFGNTSSYLVDQFGLCHLLLPPFSVIGFMQPVSKARLSDCTAEANTAFVSAENNTLTPTFQGKN
jgi:hypothetical protein